MEQHKPNETQSKDIKTNDTTVWINKIQKLEEEMLEIRSELYKSKSDNRSTTNTVEKSLVAAAGIAGGAALLSPILGPTVATVGSLAAAAGYIFVNINKTLPKPEKKSDPDDNTNA